MAQHDEFEYNPPPPSPGATPLQSIMFGGVGGFITLMSLTAVKQSPRTAMELGTFLITLGLLFGIGMVSKSRNVEIVVAMLLIFAGGISIGLARNFDAWLWYLGAAFFFACGAVVLVKDRFVTRAS
jgi:hypothetical protein